MNKDRGTVKHLEHQMREGLCIRDRVELRNLASRPVRVPHTEVFDLFLYARTFAKCVEI